VTIECRAGKDQVTIKVRALAGWRPRSTGKRFERVFGRALTVTS
jgi:hypothetical protein